MLSWGGGVVCRGYATGRDQQTDNLFIGPCVGWISHSEKNWICIFVSLNCLSYRPMSSYKKVNGLYIRLSTFWNSVSVSSSIQKGNSAPIIMIIGDKWSCMTAPVLRITPPLLIEIINIALTYRQWWPLCTGSDPGEGGHRGHVTPPPPLNFKMPLSKSRKYYFMYIIIRLCDYLPIYYSLDT